MVRTPGDNLTGDLLNWQPKPVHVGYGDEVTGRGRLDNKIARVVSRALRSAHENDLPRAHVAREMSSYLGRKITLDMLEKWASEAAETNRIPLDAFAALIDATGEHDLLGFLPRMFGFAAVPEKFSQIIELHQIEEHQAALDQAQREAEQRAAELKARLGVRK